MKKSVCPRFKKSVNMSPDSIRAWAKDPRAKEASWEATRRRLPSVAALKAKPCDSWTAKDETFAKRVLSFNARMEGMVRVHGCTRKAVISLRNWGRQPPQCSIPGGNGLGAGPDPDARGERFVLTPDDLKYTYARLTWQVVPTREINLVAVEVRPAGPEYDAYDYDYFEVKVVQESMRGDATMHRLSRPEDFMRDFGAVFTHEDSTYQLTFVLKPEAKERFSVWLDGLIERGLVAP